MMAGRLVAMKALQDLELSVDDFETEQGQTDGTLAHALERLISWQYANQGLIIKTLPGETSFVPQFGFNWV
jgi:lipopolysaccharide biosynthesis protein